MERRQFWRRSIINLRDGAIYYWDKSGGVAARAVNLVDVAGANNAPTIAKQVMVSDNSRHVIAFGTNTIGTASPRSFAHTVL